MTPLARLPLTRAVKDAAEWDRLVGLSGSELPDAWENTYWVAVFSLTAKINLSQ